MLEVVVRFKYSYARTMQLLDMGRGAMAQALRTDLTLLRLPHPPVRNIRDLTLDGITFSWTTTSNSYLFKVIMDTVSMQDDDEGLKEVMKTRFIEKIVTYTSPALHPLPPLEATWKYRSSRLHDPNYRYREQPLPQAVTSFSPDSNFSSHHPSTNHPSTSESHHPRFIDRPEKVRKLNNVLQSLRNLSNPDQPAVAQPRISKLEKFSKNFPDASPLPSPRVDDGDRPSLDIQLSVNTGDAVARVMRELWDTRREVTAATARGAAICERLDQLNAPELAQARSLDSADLDDLLRKAEIALKNERRRREEAERTLQDVQRECMGPLVVPALLQALSNISGLSSKV